MITTLLCSLTGIVGAAIGASVTWLVEERRFRRERRRRDREEILAIIAPARTAAHRVMMLLTKGHIMSEEYRAAMLAFTDVVDKAVSDLSAAGYMWLPDLDRLMRCLEVFAETKDSKRTPDARQAVMRDIVIALDLLPAAKW